MDKENEKLLVSGIIVIGLLTVVVVFITLNSQPAPQTPNRYCGDGLCINEDCSSCSLDCGQCQECPECTSPTYDYFIVELDALGARGTEEEGHGDGWLDSEDCSDSDYAQGKSYTECMIQDVQILTGSDPNPLKVNTGGAIFNNSPVFKIKCVCEI